MNQPFNFKALIRSYLWSRKIEGSLKKDLILMHPIWPSTGDHVSASFFPTYASIFATLKPSVSQHKCQYLLWLHITVLPRIHHLCTWNHKPFNFSSSRLIKERSKLKLIFTNNLILYSLKHFLAPTYFPEKFFLGSCNCKEAILNLLKFLRAIKVLSLLNFYFASSKMG